MSLSFRVFKVSNKIYTRSFVQTRNLSIGSLCKYPQKPILDFGLGKIERKMLRKRLKEAQSSLFKKHIYKKSVLISNKYELAEQMKKNEVYNEGGLVGLIKPYGISRFKKDDNDDQKKVIQTLNAAGSVSSTSVEDVLPLLKKHYDTQYLEVVFFPERYSSGILLLSLRQKLTEKVKKCFRRSLGLQSPFQTYWSVVLGKSVPEAVGERVGITLKYVHHIGKVPVITKSIGKMETQRGDVKPNIVEHIVIAHHEENDVSLVEVNVMNTKHNFIRAWLAYSYSPILGDLVFGGRVRTVLGKKIIVSPHNCIGYQPPEVPKNVLQKLYLNQSLSEIIPTHIHQSKLKLSRFHGGDKDLVITATPPDHFIWSCLQLSLMVDNEGATEPDDEDDYEDLEEVSTSAT